MSYLSFIQYFSAGSRLHKRSLLGVFGIVSIFFVACCKVVAQPVTGNTVLQTQTQIGQLIHASFNQTWQTQLTGPLYAAISSVGAIFALLTIGWYALKVLKVQFSNADIQLASIEEWVIAVILIILLSNPGSGSILGTLSLGFREATYGLSNQILSRISSEPNFISEGQVKLSVTAWAQNAVKSCISITNQEERDRCLTAAGDQLADKLAPYQNTSWANQLYNQLLPLFTSELSNPGSFGTSDYFTRLFNGAGGVAAGISSSLILTWLAAIGTGFLVCVDTCMLLTAMMGPIFLGLSFLPTPLKPIQIWATGLGSLAMVDLAYKILVGIISTTMLESPVSDPLMWQLLIAIFSPILILAMAAGGGIALMNSMGRGTTAVVRV